MLGARVAGDVVIGDGVIAHGFIEGDLLSLETGTVLDSHVLLKCVFLDASTSQLRFARVDVEADCTVCYGATLIPGTHLEPGSIVPPHKTTHEKQLRDPNVICEARTFGPRAPSMKYCLVGYLTCALLTLISYAPALVALTGVQETYLRGGMMELVAAFCTKRWFWRHFLLHSYMTIGAPVLYTALAILTKWVLVGRFTPGPIQSDYQIFRHWFMSQILDRGVLHLFASLVGPHYQIMTWYYRLLGVKCGERVFWPGVPLRITEPDLLEVGDDVVFGSRSTILCSDGHEAKPVRIESRAMLADGCVVLPGTVLERGAVVGTGTLADGTYPRHSISLGSELLSVNRAEFMSLEDHATPFGKAYYGEDGGVSSYRVMGILEIVLLNLATLLSSALLVVGVRQLILHVFWVFHKRIAFHGASMHAMYFLTCILVSSACKLCILLAIVAAKWYIIGTVTTGSHCWDQDSYNQRWKLQVTLQKTSWFSDAVLTLGGSQWLVAMYRMLGCRIGEKVCLFPFGKDMLLPEPDLVSIGDGSCIEDAHLVTHVNTHGIFTLQEINIGRSCTMRDGSRVMQQGKMQDGSLLLERSLVMPGEEVPAHVAWYGRPNCWQADTPHLTSYSGQDVLC